MPHSQEKIDAYLSGRMEGQEKENLEQDLANNQEFQKKVIQRKAYLDAIDLLVEEDLKKTFWAKRNTFIPLYQKMAIAASVLIIILAGISYWWASTQLSDEQVLVDSYIPPTFPGKKSEIEPTKADITFLQAQNAYQNDEKAEAIRLFSLLVKDSSYAVTAQFFMGHLSFKEGDYQQAASYFKRVQVQSNLPAHIISAEARANFLLARFGEGDLPQDSLQQLVTLLRQIDPQRARTLEQRVNHPIGRLFY